MPGTDLRIEKVLSRGEGKDAQVLLVLVSTPGPFGPNEDLWVAIGKSEPQSIPRLKSCQSIENARAISTAELQERDYLWDPGRNGFDLDDPRNRRHWLARFDFTDHPDVQDYWRRLVAAQDKASPGPLEVIAWRSRLWTEPVAAAEFFEPVPGHASVALPCADVVSQPLFELGVLFVHGIGNHGVRETLVEWAEPIVSIWRDWGFAVAMQARCDMDDAERQLVSERVRSHQLRNRNPIDGISEIVGEFEKPSGESPQLKSGRAPMPSAPAVPAICCAATRTDDTVFADLVPGVPSATLQRLSVVDAAAVLRESHVLFAEAHWTRETFPPSWTELVTWLTTAIPVAVWARLHRLVKTRRHEITGFGRDAANGFEQWRVAVSWVAWAAQVVVLPAAYVVGALIAQIVLGVIGLVALLPVAWLQRAIRAVLAALLGTVGQSYALQNSPIRRSAIVSSVSKNLTWLSDRCHQVVVISHSQGAEVARRVFLDSRKSNVRRWYSVGSGIAPLNMLHRRSLDKSLSKTVVATSQLALSASLILLTLLGIDAIPGLHFGMRGFTAEYLQRFWGTFVVLYGLFLVALFLGERLSPEVKFIMRHSLLGKWWDFYASEDPVPGGSLIDRFGSDLDPFKPNVPTQRRIFNTRLSVLDHTSYFRNVEEFVAPIAMDLLHFVGLGGDAAREQAALNAAARRRDLRTWWRMFVYVIGLMSVAAMVGWTAFGPAHRGIVWVEQARSAWPQGAGLWKSLGLWWSKWWGSGSLGTLVKDLWLALVVLLLLIICWAICRWLERRSVKTLVNGLAAAGRSVTP